MASGNSSSRRKSSSSHKKKRTKPSSEVRKRRSKSRKTNKSKKLRRRDASLSCSDDDSRTEDSVSVSSDSEGDYRSRRARSRTRGNTKGSRKRVRRSSSSRGDDRDSPNRRKRKGSKRKSGSDVRRKTHQRNRGNVRSRRDVSVSSTSGGSRSCSTCSGSSRSVEREFERLRGRSEERGKDKRSPGKLRNGRNKSRYRSRSSSSCSGCSNRSSYQIKERLIGDNNSRRLGSVLTVTKQSKGKEGNDRSRDENRAEIIQAYDDCPSCRSNDSYDGGRKRGLAYHPHVAPENRWVDDAKGDGAFTSKTKTTGLFEIGKEDDGAQHGGRDPTLVLIGSTMPLAENRSEQSAGNGSAENDLESFLRLKALENLKKFRGDLHTSTKSLQKNETGNYKQSSTAKVEPIQNEFHQEDSGRVVGARQVMNQNLTPMTERKTTTSQRDGKVPDKGHKSMAKLVDVRQVMDVADMPPDQNQTVVSTELTEKKNTTAGVFFNKSKPAGSTLRQESSGDQPILEQEPTSQESSKGKLLETKNVADKSVGTIKMAPGNSNIHGEEVNTPGGFSTREASCLNPTTREHIPNKLQDEANGTSQFEQKTMSVIRGGEKVQVSYKVYIPKKPPALARRQLQR